MNLGYVIKVKAISQLLDKRLVLVIAPCPSSSSKVRKVAFILDS